MITKLTATAGSLLVASCLALGSPALAAGGKHSHAAHGKNAQTSTSTTTQASVRCSANHNALFGAGIPISHGACVSTLQSKGRSSALYSGLCGYVVTHGGTLSGIAPSTAPTFLDTQTSTMLTSILSKVTMPAGGKFTNRGQCVAAFNKAKHTVLHSGSH